MRTPITKEGHARLTRELENLKSAERPAIIRAIAEARAHGDLKENAEYHSAKDKQGWIEARIKQLEGALASADIIDPAQVGGDGRCIFGAWADLRDEDKDEDAKGATITYRLVGQLEADIEHGQLSSSSPLGRALLGKRAGDEVLVETPDGDKQYTVLAVRYK